MGKRPGACDFAVFGQLTQLAMFDPTPMALTFAQTPRVCGWVTLMEDLSGEEPAEKDWFTGAAMPATIKAILREIGRTYVPVMLANAEAVAAGGVQVEASVDGELWGAIAVSVSSQMRAMAARGLCGARRGCAAIRRCLV